MVGCALCLDVCVQCLNGGSKGEWAEALELQTSGDWMLAQAQAQATGSGALVVEVWHDNVLQDAPVAHATLPIGRGPMYRYDT